MNESVLCFTHFDIRDIVALVIGIMNGQTVKVAVRIRPLVEAENKRACQSIVQKTPNQSQVQVESGNPNHLFTFNYVFAPEDTQEMVYENAVKSMVLHLFQGLLRFSIFFPFVVHHATGFSYIYSRVRCFHCSFLGYNVTIFAYGQTGSGKTHTMGTTYDGADDEDIGVIPRAVSDIFERMNEMPEFEFNVNCAFIELYQEKLYDLLAAQPREQNIVDIREMQNGKIVIPNLTEVTTTNAEDCLGCLMQASKRRAVGATAMNATSSRSHAIFTITLKKIDKSNPSAATSAKFHLVDLAGSERSKKTQTNGEQFQEGVKINEALLALSNVIEALGSASGQHIPYRDSKLTRLLQDSLGGNSMTLMIACVSPADYNREETLGTLRYANRAKKIRNKPVVNQDPATAEINALKAQVQDLRMKLMSGNGVGAIVNEKCLECDKPPTKHELLKQLHKMAEKLQATLCDIAHREDIINDYEDTIESLNQKIGDLKEQIGQLGQGITSDMSPTEIDEYKENVRILTDTVLSLNNHMIERKECIFESTKASDSPMMKMTTAGSSHADHDDQTFTQHDETYITKQTEYQAELKTLKGELAMKEELRKKVMSNLQKITDYTGIIAKLEEEKKTLEEQLRSKNTTISVKLAEERRQRVLYLETEISKMRQENKKQPMLLKERDNLAKQVTELNAGIQSMKQAKVNLIRQMKAESERFRLFRIQREKEVAQLRAKDRKMQSEVAKKEMLYEKQRNVLKRKVEEASAAAKRYKDALHKQKISKAAKRNAGAAGSMNKSGWIADEIEIITSIVDMKQSYGQLAEVRAELNARLLKLKTEKPPNTEQIEMLQEEIEMRNAQMNDLSRQMNEVDLEAKSKQLSEGVHELKESRSIIKRLLNNVIEQRQGFNNYFAQTRDQKMMLDARDEQIQQLERQLKAKAEEMRNECVRMETEHQAAADTLLEALMNKEAHSDALTILEAKKNEELARKDEEIAKKNEEIQLLRGCVKHGRKQQNTLRDSLRVDLFSDDDSEEEEIDDSADPDFRGTPMYKREKVPKRRTVVSCDYNRSTQINCSIVLIFFSFCSVQCQLIRMIIRSKREHWPTANKKCINANVRVAARKSVAVIRSRSVAAAIAVANPVVRIHSMQRSAAPMRSNVHCRRSKMTACCQVNTPPTTRTKKITITTMYTRRRDHGMFC